MERQCRKEDSKTITLNDKEDLDFVCDQKERSKRKNIISFCDRKIDEQQAISKSQILSDVIWNKETFLKWTVFPTIPDHKVGQSTFNIRMMRLTRLMKFLSHWNWAVNAELKETDKANPEEQLGDLKENYAVAVEQLMDVMRFICERISRLQWKSNIDKREMKCNKRVDTTSIGMSSSRGDTDNITYCQKTDLEINLPEPSDISSSEAIRILKLLQNDWGKEDVIYVDDDDDVSSDSITRISVPAKDMVCAKNSEKKSGRKRMSSLKSNDGIDIHEALTLLDSIRECPSPSIHINQLQHPSIGQDTKIVGSDSEK
jgi:hypothetical protein